MAKPWVSISPQYQQRADHAAPGLDEFGIHPWDIELTQVDAGAGVVQEMAQNGNQARPLGFSLQGFQRSSCQPVVQGWQFRQQCLTKLIKALGLGGFADQAQGVF